MGKNEHPYVLNPFDPVSFIGPGWTIVEEDARSCELSGFHHGQINLVSALDKDETSLPGTECIARLKGKNSIRLDARFFHFFWNNKDEIPKGWKRAEKASVINVTFDGTIFQSPGGINCVLSLSFDTSWNYHLSLTDRIRGRTYLSPILADQPLKMAA